MAEENRVVLEHEYPGGARLQIVEGDLTREAVDAIVNAANAQLRHGGGVARAVVRSGGQEIQEESDAWVQEHGPVPHDQPAYTGAGDLPSRYVIHAVGPRWGEGDEEDKLAAAIEGSLALAERLDLTSLAFPAISTGIYGFPTDRAADVFVETLDGYFRSRGDAGLDLVRITLFDRPTVDAFRKAWDRRLGGRQVVEP